MVFKEGAMGMVLTEVASRGMVIVRAFARGPGDAMLQAEASRKCKAGMVVLGINGKGICICVCMRVSLCVFLRVSLLCTHTNPPITTSTTSSPCRQSAARLHAARNPAHLPTHGQARDSVVCERRSVRRGCVYNQDQGALHVSG